MNELDHLLLSPLTDVPMDATVYRQFDGKYNAKCYFW